MLVQHYKDMLSSKSVIRTLSEWATKRGEVIGYENVFDYSLGNPSVAVPQAFTDSLIDMLRNMDSTKLHGYSPSLGLPSVKAAVAKSLAQRYGLPYQAQHIFMTSGAAGAVAHAVRLIAKQGEEIITVAPFFPEYRQYVEAAGPKLVVLPPDETSFQIPIDALEQAINEKTAAVLINTPNNPSGVVYTQDTLQKLANCLREKSKEIGHVIYLISDEPYREILFDQAKPLCPCAFYESSLMCYSYSKSLSIPGGRIGYLAVHPHCEDAEIMIQMCGQISRGIGHNCPTSLMQLGIAEALDLTADLSVYETNRNLLYEELLSLGFTCVKPGGTFYLFPKALEEDANAFCQKALAYDLVLVPGDSFGAPGYFRIAYCVETDKVKRSLPALRAFVKEQYPG
ncbi:MAG: pyridoxal phosphate-dependent aminotransferase [Clostridium sp.]|jgi:aspartate aminotransferase|nr:pyridoxal phosphate-dependent aminotransferase [Clostridium sp.]